MMFQEIQKTLIAYIQNPIQQIARLPRWSFKQVLFTQLVIAALVGFATGLFPFHFWKVLQGLILFPITVTVMSVLLTSFFYYYFQIFEYRTESFTQIFELVFFANIFYFIFHIGSGFFAPADLIGLGLSSVLLAVGLTENFSLERKKSLRLVGLLFGMLLLIWLSEKIYEYRITRDPSSVTSL